MSLIGTAIGALVALVPALRPKGDKGLTPVIDPELDRHVIEALTVEIERLERELLLERQLCAHWRQTAQTIARQSREAREAQIGWQQHDALVQQAQAQQAFALQAQYQQLLARQNSFEGLCNCVPSRAQMWGAQHGLVQRLNDGSD